MSGVKWSAVDDKRCTAVIKPACEDEILVHGRGLHGLTAPTEILDGIQVGDYNKMDYGNSNVAGKMRRSDGRTDDKEYDGIWQM